MVRTVVRWKAIAAGRARENGPRIIPRHAGLVLFDVRDPAAAMRRLLDRLGL